ncbi:lig_chan-Glu_bd domain-containing protein [Caerostris extrusa]|uniref:Lig_chan-Glu_bd domain-containing protein n=1 Tax=Caerostris extrusa TaxID=172846 RepID=A0AAV4XNE9_CAEEX|nr:lig_chan-Glu_bd domain-containing protein [Caerostris extrusa]
MEKMKFPSFITIAVNNVLGVCHLRNNSQGEFYLAEGVMAELLPILAATLKFKYKLTAPQDRQWGKKEANGNWTGMIGLVHRGEADMATCDIIISEERREVIDYSYPYDILEMVFANKAPELLPKFFACFYPFSFGLWLAILGLIITMPFFWRFLFSTKFSPIQLLGNVYYTILSGASSIRIVSLRDYVLLGTWIAAIFVPVPLLHCCSLIVFDFTTAREHHSRYTSAVQCHNGGKLSQPDLQRHRGSRYDKSFTERHCAADSSVWNGTEEALLLQGGLRLQAQSHTGFRDTGKMQETLPVSSSSQAQRKQCRNVRVH